MKATQLISLLYYDPVITEKQEWHAFNKHTYHLNVPKVLLEKCLNATNSKPQMLLSSIQKSVVSILDK